MSEITIRYTPIGVFHTSFNPNTGAPRQGILRPEGEGTIEVFEAYRDALRDLERFEYVWVLFHFDEVTGWKPRVTPSESTHTFGLFATRSPRRPNPIGLTAVRLVKLEDAVLYVRGVDAFEGAPVLDIKPYLPSIDIVLSEQNAAVEKHLGHHDEDFISDPAFYE